MKTLTLICYRENGADYSSGECRDEYDSEFEFHNNLNEEELIDLLSQYMLDNMRFKENLNKFHFIVLNNGIKIYDEIVSKRGIDYDERLQWGEDRLEYENNAIKERQKAANDFMTNIINKSSEIAKELNIKVDEEVKRIKDAKKEAAKLDSEKMQRMLYESLKHKFENNE